MCLNVVKSRDGIPTNFASYEDYMQRFSGRQQQAVAGTEAKLGLDEELGDDDIFAHVSADEMAKARQAGIAATGPDVNDIKLVFEALLTKCIFCDKSTCRSKCSVERKWTYKDFPLQAPQWRDSVFYCQVCDCDGKSHTGYRQNVSASSSCAPLEKITLAGANLGKF